MALLLALLTSSLACALAQHGPPPKSSPHNYPGRPSGGLSPAWQDYFLVKDPLPNVTFPLERSFAGNIPVDRPGHPNDTLFFVAFEKSNGSLTRPSNDSSNDPWSIWLNGGPGSSSMYGLFFENGPIRLNRDYSASPNNYSWHTLSDYFWLDQPVGVGYSTADAGGYIHDEDQMGTDFMGFLGNLVKVFPSLKTRPLHLTGESYAGMYIPYIMKAYFNMENPPVNIAKIVIGDGSIASGQVFELLPALSVIETFPQLIGYDQDVYKYFKAQTHLCQYDVNLTYPQDGIMPTIPIIEPSQRELPFMSLHLDHRTFMRELYKRASSLDKRDLVRRNASEFLENRSLDVIDPWYGCILLEMYIDYALNYTFPWVLSRDSETFGFDVYDVPDAINPSGPGDGSVFLNDPRTRKALHAPRDKDWIFNFDSVFDGNPETFDPSPEPMVFLSELAANATAHNIGVVLYSGNNDALIAHRGTEVTIQNTTFGGIQGFTRKPSTPFYDNNGVFAGIIHQERNWTYALFHDAGHTIPLSVPAAAYAFFREFIIGSNTTGLVTTTPNGGITVIGGEDPILAEDIMPGEDEIFYGSVPGESTYIAPSATREAWRSFIRTETARPTSGTVSRQSSSAVGRWKVDMDMFLAVISSVGIMLLVNL